VEETSKAQAAKKVSPKRLLTSNGLNGDRTQNSIAMLSTYLRSCLATAPSLKVVHEALIIFLTDAQNHGQFVLFDLNA
jgi:hypothetical protein